MLQITTILFLLLTPLVLGDLWIHVNVEDVERKPCPNDETSWGSETNGCATMSYMTLDERILPQHERRSSSFEHINGVTRPTVTHWPKGKIADWMMSIQFISVDPVYGLARTCDRSGYIRVFQNESTKRDEPEFLERSVKIQGQCFSATVKIQASHEICPWCMDDTKTTTTSTTTVIPTTTVSSPLALFSFQSENSFIFVTMFILALFSFLALAATAVLLVVYVCDRRKNRLENPHEDLFDMPHPMANSTVRVDTTCPFSTKSSERWTEYGGEPWGSFRPLDIEASFIPPKETYVYKVVQSEEDDSSSDSGNGSI